MLTFGMKAPLSFERLITLCKGMIPDQDIAVVRSVVAPAGILCGEIRNKTLARWYSFETMLRNEFVMIRAARKKTDATKYLRRDGCPESAHAAHIAINAYRKPSLMESERALDQERWQELDELALGHYFDVDSLIIYACKLLILEKWDRINAADKKQLLENALTYAAV